MNTYKEVIDRLPDETPTTMMGDCVNKNLDDLKKSMNDINEIGVDGQEVETKDINNEYIIHRYMTENESNTNRDTLKN